MYYKKLENKEKYLNEIELLKKNLLENKNNENLIKTLLKLNSYNYMFNFKNSIRNINEFKNINEKELIIYITLCIILLDLLYTYIKKDYYKF